MAGGGGLVPSFCRPPPARALQVTPAAASRSRPTPGRAGPSAPAAPQSPWGFPAPRASSDLGRQLPSLPPPRPARLSDESAGAGSPQLLRVSAPVTQRDSRAPGQRQPQNRERARAASRRGPAPPGPAGAPHPAPGSSGTLLPPVSPLPGPDSKLTSDAGRRATLLSQQFPKWSMLPGAGRKHGLRGGAVGGGRLRPGSGGRAGGRRWVGTSGAFTRSHGGGARGVSREKGENHPAEQPGREETCRPGATC